MDLQNLMPQQAQPISRITSGQLPTELAELSEAMMSGSTPEFDAVILPSDFPHYTTRTCSYDGDDAE